MIRPLVAVVFAVGLAAVLVSACGGSSICPRTPETAAPSDTTRDTQRTCKERRR